MPKLKPRHVGAGSWTGDAIEYIMCGGDGPWTPEQIDGFSRYMRSNGDEKGLALWLEENRFWKSHGRELTREERRALITAKEGESDGTS